MIRWLRPSFRITTNCRTTDANPRQGGERAPGSEQLTGPYSADDGLSYDFARARDAGHVDRARFWRCDDAAWRRPPPIEQADAVARDHAGAGAVAAGDADAARTALALVPWCG